MTPVALSLSVYIHILFIFYFFVFGGREGLFFILHTLFPTKRFFLVSVSVFSFFLFTGGGGEGEGGGGGRVEAGFKKKKGTRRGSWGLLCRDRSLILCQ